MKRIISISAIIVISCIANAFHVQIGISGKSMDISKAIKEGTLISPICNDGWVGNSVDWGATPEHIGIGASAYTPYPQIGASVPFETTEYSSSIGTSLTFTKGNYNTVYYYDNTTKKYIDIKKSMYLGTVGSYTLPWIDHRMLNTLITIKGDPYSIILNDTDMDVTVNGVELKSGEGKRLKWPIWLIMQEISGIRFYDLDTGEQITPYDFAPYGSRGQYYDGDSYLPYWTGNIRFTNRAITTNEVPKELILYGDIKSSNQNKVLFGKENDLIYNSVVYVATNFYLMTEWKFNQDSYKNCKAKINNVVVCDGHATTHIIDYNVSTGDMKINYITGKGHVDFTMSIDKGEGSGGPCTFRCWNKEYATFDEAPSAQRASISGNDSTVARFRVTAHVYSGTWTLSAVQ